MQIELAIATSFSIALAFFLVADKFITSNRWVRIGCFLCLFFVEFIFMRFLPFKAGFTEMAIATCGFIMSLYIYANIKNYLKSADIAITIILYATVFVFLCSIPLKLIQPMFLSLGINPIVNFIIMQISIISFGFLLRKYKDYFFIPSENVKLLLFYFTFKTLIFILLNFVIQILFRKYTDLYYIALLSFVVILIINFFCIKYVTRTLSELEKEKQKAAVALKSRQVEAEHINKRYDEIIKYRHYYNSLYRSLIQYINEKDMAGLEDYYAANITPIHEELSKEIKAYDQIKHIHIPMLKARIVELINTVSQLPNVEFVLHMDSVVDCAHMEELDLFTVVNIFIDNAVEETMTQEKGWIRIEMSQYRNVFICQIKNTLVDSKSTPKPNNAHKGMDIVTGILSKYLSASFVSEIDVFGKYVQTLKVVRE